MSGRHTVNCPTLITGICDYRSFGIFGLNWTMNALHQNSTGYEWKNADPGARREFCSMHLALTAPHLSMDPSLLHDALQILYSTDKRIICDIPLGDAAELITRSKEKTSPQSARGDVHPS
jgi:hypothetical protein